MRSRRAPCAAPHTCSPPCLVAAAGQEQPRAPLLPSAQSADPATATRDDEQQWTEDARARAHSPGCEAAALKEPSGATLPASGAILDDPDPIDVRHRAPLTPLALRSELTGRW